jgi:hypothetical protein
MFFDLNNVREAIALPTRPAPSLPANEWQRPIALPPFFDHLKPRLRWRQTIESDERTVQSYICLNFKFMPSNRKKFHRLF